MRNRLYTIITCWLISSSLIALGSNVWAQSSRQNTEIVVLDNGRVLRGWITRRAGTVEIRTTADSRIVLPVKKVAAICGSLDEAYQHRVSRLSEEDIEGNVALLHWCLQHRLETPSQLQLTRLMRTNVNLRQLSYLDQKISQTFEEASGSQPAFDSIKNPSEKRKPEQAHLKVVSQLVGTDPEFTPLPAMEPKTDEPFGVIADTQVRLASHVRPVEPTQEQGTNRAKIEDIKTPSAATSVRAQLDAITDQMSRGDLHQFQRRVQPVLLKGCLAAKCHSGSDEVMPLLHRGHGQLVPKRFTQRNLQSILSWVDGGDVANSKLLSAAQQVHGGQKEAAFEPGSKQFQLVSDWVHSIADNTPGLLAERRSGPLNPSKRPSDQVAIEPPVDPAQPSKQPVNNAAATDPFDPAVFNRLSH